MLSRAGVALLRTASMAAKPRGGSSATTVATVATAKQVHTTSCVGCCCDAPAATSHCGSYPTSPRVCAITHLLCLLH